MTDADHEAAYRRKIKTRDELKALIGPRPRDRKVIMCHGAFDLVHPGHIRHMMYAKSKADILVASLTSDAHIGKAHYRPFVPQQLRAMNLSALEIVDFVIIDAEAEPTDNIRFLQPDYFAKGYEYSDGGVHPKTAEEMKVLDSYGGEIIFTPGDVVYSSSAIINLSPPSIGDDKLHALMDSEGVSFPHLHDALGSFGGVRVHVVGDTIVDSYVYCTPIGGGATKTPTLSVKRERQVDFSGGAAIVARHLRQAGADVKFTTVLGDDELKDMVLQDLSQSDVQCVPLVDTTRPTTRKTAFIANGYRLLKVDTVDNRPVSARILSALTDSIKNTPTDAVVFSDFRHGIYHHETIPALTESIPAGVLKVGDSQVASRWGNILDFHGFDLITPNEREARFSLGDQDSVVRPLALELYKKAGCKLLILKMGERGIITYRAPSPDARSFFTIDSFADKVLDPVGTGDALLAYSTLALVTTKSPVIASILGTVAAAVACEHDGNQPVTPEAVREKLLVIEKRVTYA